MDLKSSLFELSAKVGQADRLLNIYENVIGESPFMSNITVDEEISNYRLSESDIKGYVFFPLLTTYTSHLRRFCVLAHVFRSNGYKPIILYNENDLLVRPENTIENDYLSSRSVRNKYKLQKYMNLFGLNPISIQDTLNNNYKLPDIENKTPAELRSFIYQNTNLADCAFASARKYLKKYSIDLSNKSENKIFKKILFSGVLIADATETIIDDFNVEVAIVHEANYIQGNIPLQICDDNGIKTYNLGTGYHQDQIIVGKSNDNHYMPQFASKNLTNQAVNTKLSMQESSQIESIFEKRKAGSITNVKYTTDNSSSVTTDENYLVGIFSHLLWDGALEPDQALYDNIYNWLDDTLQVAIEKKDTHFIIKSHPAEDIRGTNEATGDWIREHYAPLPDHITFLPPNTDINTYALIDDLDAAVVYASTVGLEVALEGKPVLVGGYPPYHDCGISYDPLSKSKYIEFLQNIEQLEHGSERQARARRFAHFLFVCKHIDFPHLSKSNGKLEFKHDEITAEDSTYANIVNQMLQGEEVLRQDCQKLKSS